MFCVSASLSCVSNSNDICTVAIKNIRNMHDVSTNQTPDILHFNDNGQYVYCDCLLSRLRCHKF